jgi:ADP-ribose pyrophosphatase YjhB (NUDIX family)
MCGFTLETKLQEGKERLVCTSCGFTFYQNPKPCTAVLVERDNKLLLVKRGIEPFKGWWDLPGGFIEEYEHPEDGAKREVKEETGLEISIAELLGIEMDTYSDDKISTMNFHYLAYPLKGEAKPESDVDEARWFLPDELPENIAFDNCRNAVSKWKRLKI